MDKNFIILLAGYPATGKTYMADIICEKYKDIKKISPDDFKVFLWKKKGFENLEEKDRLVDKSWEMYYDNLAFAMKNKEKIISEYPFSDKQKSHLEKLCANYNYNVITIRLIADFEELYERHLHRDIKGKRDIVYNVTSYNPETPPTVFKKADDIVSRQEFLNRYENRGYGDFKLGSLIEVDTTIFSSVDYKGIVEKLSSEIKDK